MLQTSPEQLTAIKGFIRQTMNNTGKPIAQIRVEQEESLKLLPAPTGVSLERTAIAGIPAEWVGADGIAEDSRQVVLYFHGGGFYSGSCETHRGLAAEISKAAGVRILTFDYRLAPEHRYPAANDDGLAVYRALIESGVQPKEIVFGGDSIGASLALMTLLTLRDSGEPLPAGAFLLSPHTDLIHFASDSYITHAELDPTNSLEASRMCAELYAVPGEPIPALFSPLACELGGLPPLWIQVGDQEVLLGECRAFTERAKAAGITVTLEEWEGMWCAFQMLSQMLAEGKLAIEHIGGFVRSRLV